MLSRIGFACFCTLLILTSLLAGFMGNKSVLVAGLIIVVLVVVFCIAAFSSEAAEATIGDGVGLVMRTNNRLHTIVCLLFVLSVVLVVYNGFGPPVLAEQADHNLAQSGASRPSDIRQRILDRSAGLDPDRKVQVETQVNYNSWETFWVRFWCSALLGLCTFVYFFVAYSDEFAAAVRKIHRKYGGSDAEDTAGLSWSERISDTFRLWRELKAPSLVPVAGTAPAIEGSAGGFSAKTQFGMEVGAELIIAIAREIYYKIFSRGMNR